MECLSSLQENPDLAPTCFSLALDECRDSLLQAFVCGNSLGADSNVSMSATIEGLKFTFVSYACLLGASLSSYKAMPNISYRIRICSHDVVCYPHKYPLQANVRALG